MHSSARFSSFLLCKSSNIFSSYGSSPRGLRVCVVSMAGSQASVDIPAAPIFLPEGPWKEIPGGVTAAKGLKAAGMYGGLRAKGEKPDIALVTCDVDAVSAESFTTNVVAAASVLFCIRALDISRTACAVLINAVQANAAMGDTGYPDVIECVKSLAELLKMKPEEVLVVYTGVIGQRIKKGPLLNSLPKLVKSLSSSVEGADSAAVEITTTDLVSNSVAIESLVGGTKGRIGGMAKGSGMTYPNMATMLWVITTNAQVTSNVWRKMAQVAVNRSFNHITVDVDTSTNDTVIALASRLSGISCILSLESTGATQLQACLDAISVTGANNEAEAAKIAHSVASSSLVKAAVYGRDPNRGRIACIVGYSGIAFHQHSLGVQLGDFLLMDGGEPQLFDRGTASNYLRKAVEIHGTVEIYT